MSEKFVVTIPVKPYVKRFIEDSYGLPADFSSDPEIQKIVNRCLKNPRTKFDKLYEKQQLLSYTDTLEIVISQASFYHYGWEFSLTDVVSFGQYFETRVKYIMRNMIGIDWALEHPITDSVIDFKDIFGFDDNDWQYDSIIKDFQRHGARHKISYKKEIMNKMRAIAFQNLFEIGMVNEKYYKKFMQILSTEKDNITLKNTLKRTI